MSALWRGHEMFETLQNRFRADGRFVTRSGQFNHWFAIMYGAWACTGIRRQNRPDKKSLAWVIAEVEAFPQLAAREWFVGLHATELQQTAGNVYDRLVADGAACPPPELFQAHRQLLSTACDGVVGFVDRRVAHADSRPLRTRPTYGDIEPAIKALEEVTLLYRLLVTGSAPDTLRAPLDPAWMNVFEIPWMPPDKGP